VAARLELVAIDEHSHCRCSDERKKERDVEEVVFPVEHARLHVKDLRDFYDQPGRHPEGKEVSKVEAEEGRVGTNVLFDLELFDAREDQNDNSQPQRESA
jgi:hypothetical protein